MTKPTLLDQPAEVRKDEPINTAPLLEFLADSLDTLPENLQVRQFPAGHSNLTYLITSGDQQWVLRRPPLGATVKSAHDMGREYRVLSGLYQHFPYCPQPILYCENESILGCSFYLMSYVQGCIIRREYPPALTITPGQIGRQYYRWLDVLCELHAVDYEAAGLENLGRPQGYVQRQVEGWSQRYRNAMTDSAPNFNHTMQWLHDKMPAENHRACIIHNDYKLDNVIWSVDDPLRLIGVLDWEMATLGDPLMDLGCTLGYWTEAEDPEPYRHFRSMPTDVAGAPTRRQLIQHFCEKSGLTIDSFDFYLCFGVFRRATILQQIYYRFYHGQTKDPRFAQLINAVKSFNGMCSSIIQRSDL